MGHPALHYSFVMAKSKIVCLIASPLVNLLPLGPKPCTDPGDGFGFTAPKPRQTLSKNNHMLSFRRLIWP